MNDTDSRRPMRFRKVPKIAAVPDVRPPEVTPAPTALQISMLAPAEPPPPPALRSPDGRLLPGQSSNPGGSPEKVKQARVLSTTLNRLLAMGDEEWGVFKPATKAETIAWSMVSLASAGDKDMMKLVWERAEGKSPVSAEKMHSSVEDVTKRVSSIAISRANAAAAIAGGVPEDPQVLEVPDDGADDSQGSDGESPVEAGAAD